MPPLKLKKKGGKSNNLKQLNLKKSNGTKVNKKN
jgi:hypothetical protein